MFWSSRQQNWPLTLPLARVQHNHAMRYSMFYPGVFGETHSAVRVCQGHQGQNVFSDFALAQGSIMASSPDRPKSTTQQRSWYWSQSFMPGQERPKKEDQLFFENSLIDNAPHHHPTRPTPASVFHQYLPSQPARLGTWPRPLNTCASTSLLLVQNKTEAGEPHRGQFIDSTRCSSLPRYLPRYM